MGRVQAIASAPQLQLDHDPESLRRSGFRALRELLARLGDRRPLILAIDDVPWGDIDSVHLLSALLVGEDPPCLLLLIAYRSEDIEHSAFIAQTRALLERIPIAQELIELCPLSVKDCGELLESDGNSAPISQVEIERMTQDSGGNPLLVQELMHAYRQRRSGNDSRHSNDLSDLTWSRIESLEASVQHLLFLVEFAGRPVAERALWQRKDPEYNRRLQLLYSLRRLRPINAAESDFVDTYHDRIREVVISKVSPERQIELHRELVVILSNSHCTTDQLAFHLQSYGRLTEAGEQYLKAAREAQAIFAFDQAVVFFRQAIRFLAPSDEMLGAIQSELADSLAFAGHSEDAANTYLSAVSTCRFLDRHVVLDHYRKAALHYFTAGCVAEGNEISKKLFRELGLHFPTRRMDLLLRLAAKSISLRFKKLPQNPPPRLCSQHDQLMLDSLMSSAYGLGLIDPVKASYFIIEACRVSLQAGNLLEISRAFSFHAGYSASLGEGARTVAMRYIAFGEQVAQLSIEQYALAFCELMHGVTCYCLQDFKGAVGFLNSARAALTSVVNRNKTWDLLSLNLFENWTRYFAGDVRTLACELPELLADAKRRNNFAEIAGLVFSKILVDISDGRLDEYERDVDFVFTRDLSLCPIVLTNAVTSFSQLQIARNSPEVGLNRMREFEPIARKKLVMAVQIMRSYVLDARAR